MASLPGLTLPGLSLTPNPSSTPGSAAPAAPGTTPSGEPRTIALSPKTEFRFEVSHSSTLSIKLTNGTAELFGTELACNAKEPYIFRGYKGAVYTWHGCRLQVEGETESEYVAEETPMVEYANVGFAIEAMRRRTTSSLDKPMGPRVLVVGPDNAGKTSLVKILTAYAVKMGRQPIAVNLDPRQGMLTVPGSLSAAAMASILDVEEGWGSSPINGPSPVPVKMPLVYHYGLGAPDDNARMYRGLVTRMALAVTSRMSEDDEAKRAGCVVDTPGALSVDKKGVYEHIQHIVSEFSVTTILVLGSERLYSDLSRRFAKPTSPISTDEPLTVLRLDKSGGCVDRDPAFSKAQRQTQIRSYFFGHGPTTLSPHTHRVDYAALPLWKVVDEGAARQSRALAASLLPGGRVRPSLQLVNALVAVTVAEPGEASSSQERLRDASVLGYVYVADVDEAKGQVRVLAPMGGTVPLRAMVVGSWPEDAVGLVG
ncbi:mRNA cleavage and polyadenylation factor IA/II complex [Phyllosticta citriasiana]|uniref:mRNA cleavage and polyadenylation factor IA/II complex n=1 Tax=Phyllosticta citriasiana TaxID=595635 RepID=UPI0030FD93BA